MSNQTTFKPVDSRTFALLVARMGKAGKAFDDGVQEAIAQAIYQGHAYGNIAYADRLCFNVPTWARKRVDAFVRHFSNLTKITKDQRAKAHADGKTIPDSRIWNIVKGSTADISTPELKAQAEQAAIEKVETLPHWREWSKAQANQDEKVAKPYAFAKAFSAMVDKLANSAVADTDVKQAAALQSFTAYIQGGQTLADLRAEIHAEILAKMPTQSIRASADIIATATPAKPATRKRQAAQQVAA